MTTEPDVEIVARMIEECIASPGWFYEDIAARILSALRERGYRKDESFHMETAPRDGTTVLLFYGHWGLGQWDDDKYAKASKPFWYYGRIYGKNHCRNHPPTAWLPLPPAPQTEAEDG